MPISKLRGVWLYVTSLARESSKAPTEQLGLTQMPQAGLTSAVAAFASWLLQRRAQGCGGLPEGDCLCAVDLPEGEEASQQGQWCGEGKKK